MIPLLILVGAGLVGWEKYTHPSDRTAGHKYAEIDGRTNSEEIVRAVRLYRLATTTGNERAAEQLKVLLDEWLNAHAEGREKLAKMLAAEKRGYDVLMFVGRMLRETGAQAEACSLIEEAYSKAANNARKFAAAAARAMLATELDEKIVWLRRANPNDAQIEANLCAARAEKAYQEGETAEAEAQLRHAIDRYAHIPENASVLNNAALIHFSLYRITGDRRLLDKAGTMLEKAIALAPSDSILLSNAVDTLLDAAVRDVIGDSIDLKALKKTGDDSLLHFLYADQVGKRRVTERMCAHPAAIKATAFLERLLVLSPKDPGVYRRLRTLYAAQQSAGKLRDLVARLDQEEPDLSAQAKMARDYFAGKRDEPIRQEIEAQRARCAQLVKKMGRDRRGITYAVAATELAVLQMNLDRVGRPADAEEVVSLAESAHAAAASDATRRALEVTLLFRASRSLAHKDRAFAALVSRTRRSLEAKDQIAVVLMHESETRRAALADADVRRVLELVRQSRRQFPDDPSKWAWIMLQAADAEEAAQLVQVIRNDPSEAVLQAIDWRLAPFNAAIALRTCWSFQVAGKDREGAAILKQCAALGTPMPDHPPR